MKTVRWFALLGRDPAGSVAVPATASPRPPRRQRRRRLCAVDSAGGIDYVHQGDHHRAGRQHRWHWHDGRLFGVSGTARSPTPCRRLHGGRRLSRRRRRSSRTRGPDHVHVGRNLGRTPWCWLVDYIVPAGKPLAVDVPDPGCGILGLRPLRSAQRRDVVVVGLNRRPAAGSVGQHVLDDVLAQRGFARAARSGSCRRSRRVHSREAGCSVAATMPCCEM